MAKTCRRFRTGNGVTKGMKSSANKGTLGESKPSKASRQGWAEISVAVRGAENAGDQVNDLA